MPRRLKAVQLAAAKHEFHKRQTADMVKWLTKYRQVLSMFTTHIQHSYHVSRFQSMRRWWTLSGSQFASVVS